MLHLEQDDKERASSIDEQPIDEALGISLFFSPFLLDCGTPLAAYAKGCRPKEWNIVLLCWTRRSRITSELFTLKFNHVRAKFYPTLLLHSDRSLLMLLRRHFFALSSLWIGTLVATGREKAKRIERKIPLLCIFQRSWPAYHELGRGGWWFWDTVENAFLCLGTFLIRSGLLALFHSFVIDDTQGIFLWWFFFLMTEISMILFS
uniref:Cytochrome c assembly protein domain-containing protein n=1 Tax=Solanum lycopersicum TaxID=4081 RepID=K4BRW1_SOLLC